MKRPGPPRLGPYLSAFVAGVLVIAFFTYRSYEAQRLVLQSDAQRDLLAIADLKAAQVALWRSERLADARVLAADALLMPGVQAVLNGTASPEARAGVAAWTDTVRASYRYASLVMTDAAGVLRLSTGSPFGSPEDYLPITARALAESQLSIREAPPAAGQHPHFVLASPIRAAGGTVLGAIVLEIDPDASLYRTLLDWPRPSATGKIAVLFQDDGRDRFSELSDPDGTRVVAATAHVPDSSWRVLARLNESEALAALARGSFLRWLFAGLLAVTFGAALAGVWRYQVSAYYRQLYDAEAERQVMQQRFDTLQEQLRQSQKLESIGRLAGGIAHDFNNLLTVINGYSDMLVTRLKGDRPLQGIANEIQKAGGRAAQLTQQLLAFSRKQVTQPRPLAINALVRDSQTLLGRLVGEDIRLIVDCGADRDRVVADPGQLHQVLVNLVVNARDAMPHGGSITISTASSAPHVVISVIDTGTGMDAATRAQIFEPFFTTKPPGQGTGLGLSTVYGIVTQHNGRIEVVSETGKGTTVSVLFPMTDAPITEVDAGPALPPSLRGTETVLIAEDQDDVREFVTMSLRTYGYTVIEAASGAAAVEVSGAHDGPIDLLVTDVVMPGMNGKELADRLRLTRPGIRVLFMSGYSDDVLSQRGALQPEVAYLQKPFSSADLAREARSVLAVFSVPRRILVVDDDVAIRNLFQQLLTPLGCEVLVAANGHEVRDQVREQPEIDVLVFDVLLPGSDTPQVIEAARQACPRAKLIVMSGAFEGHMNEAALALQADAQLTKPIGPGQLRDALRLVHTAVKH